MVRLQANYIRISLKRGGPETVKGLDYFSTLRGK
jgi:hypothetical protein